MQQQSSEPRLSLKSMQQKQNLNQTQQSQNINLNQSIRSNRSLNDSSFIMDAAIPSNIYGLQPEIPNRDSNDHGNSRPSIGKGKSSIIDYDNQEESSSVFKTQKKDVRKDNFLNDISPIAHAINLDSSQFQNSLYTHILDSSRTAAMQQEQLMQMRNYMDNESEQPSFLISDRSIRIGMPDSNLK